MRLKYIWYAVVGLFFLLSFFGVLTLPKDWAGTLGALASLERWWSSNAAYPAISAFLVGLAISTIFVPAAISLARDHLFPSKPKPDIGAAEAFNKLLLRSKLSRSLLANGLSVPVMYESHLTPAGVIEARLKKQIESELWDSLRQGRVLAWGVPRNSRAEKEIEKDEWHHMNLELDDQIIDAPRPNVFSSSKNGIQYHAIRFCQKNIFAEFPLTIWPRRIDYIPLEKRHLSEAE
jgi:hypothetical protein